MIEDRPVSFLVTEHKVNVLNCSLELVRVRVTTNPVWEELRKEFPHFPEFKAIVPSQIRHEFAGVVDTPDGLRLFTINSVHNIVSGDTG